MSRKWIATHLTANPDSVAARVLFQRGLDNENLLTDQLRARLDDPDSALPDDDAGVPLLLAISDNGTEMRADDTRRFMALCSIAQHFGRPSTPTDQAWIESLWGHVKREHAHLMTITDPVVLAAELERVRARGDRGATRRGSGVRAIAREIGRSPSTISRELRRNAATRSGQLKYRAGVAQWKAELAARRPKTAKQAANVRLRDYVQDRLAGTIHSADGSVGGPPTATWKGRNRPRRQDRVWATAWSPEQISKRLRIDFPEDDTMRISHEAIYQALYIQSRGTLKRELVACLRTGRALRVPRARAQQRARGHVTDAVMISERPPDADDRAVPGHVRRGT